MGHAARLAFFTSPLSLVFLLTLLTLCFAAPAPVPDHTFTIDGFPFTIKTPGEGGPGGGPGSGGGGGGGGLFGGGGNPFTKFPTPPNRDPTTTPQKPPSTPTPTPPAAPPKTTPPPPPPPSSPTKAPAAPAAPPSSPANPNGGQKPSSKSNTPASSTKKSSSPPAFPTGPTIPAGIVTGSSVAGTPTISPSDPASSSPAAANAASSHSSNSKLLAGILIPIILIIFLLLAVAAVVVYKRRRDRARAAETPTSQWVGGGGASTGAWSRLDMASRYDLASPAPSPAPSPLPHTPNALVISGRALDITEFRGSAVSVSTFSTPPASSSGHDAYVYGGTGEGGSEFGSGSGVGTPSTAAPTDGHGHNASVSASAYATPAYSAAGHTFATGRTDDGHSMRYLPPGPRTEDDHGSIFANSPFESESPLHWQNEPALADSRPTSLDSAVPPPLPPLPHSMVYDPANSPVYGLRGSTMLAYDRDSTAPEAFDPRRSELM